MKKSSVSSLKKRSPDISLQHKNRASNTFSRKTGGERVKLLLICLFLPFSDLQKFDDLKNPEVNEFRWKMKVICDEVVSSRNKLSWIEQVSFDGVLLAYQFYLSFYDFVDG